jgi:quercetin dioxygenase-like cupin family protein
MNILENLAFTDERPSVYPIQRTEKINYLAIGLRQDQILKKHTANVPSLLTVLKGEVEFFINGETLHLKEFDTYNIPIQIEHEVKGVKEKNIFTLVQEK